MSAPSTIPALGGTPGFPDASSLPKRTRDFTKTSFSLGRLPYPRHWRRHWPLLATMLILWLFLAGVIARGLAKSEGHFVYALDDAYIHMAIAKNLVQHGNWGVTRYEFSPAASSILWPLILALCQWLFRLDHLAPLVLNLILSALFLIFASVVLRNAGLKPWPSFLALLAIAFVTPLPALIAGGMEHVLQLCVTSFFLYVTSQVLSQDRPAPTGRDRLAVLLLAPLVTLTRYEGVFVIVVACLLLTFRRQVALAATVGVTALAPLAAFSLVCLWKVSLWLPTPVLLKGNRQQTAPLMGLASEDVRVLSLFDKLVAAPYLWLLVIGALFVSLGQTPLRSSRHWRMLATLFTLITLLHIRFAAVGWLFRYEAYLVALGMLVLFCGAAQSGWTWTATGMRLRPWPQRVSALILVALLAHPFVDRMWMASRHLPNEFPIYYQLTYQESRFLDMFYKGASVAITDVGAPTYFADIQLLDLIGLASVDVARMRWAGRWRGNDLYQLAKKKGVEIAIVNHRSIAEEIVPREWIKVGEWRLKGSTPFSTAFFYATESRSVPRLTRNLSEFANRLPRDVKAVLTRDAAISK